MKLKYPWQRDDILSVLKELKDFDYQQQHWLNNQVSEGEFVGGIDLAMDLLYDQFDLLDDPKGGIGVFLCDDEEASILNDLAVKLEEVFDDVGVPSEKKCMESSLWSDVMIIANNSYNLIIKNNEQYNIQMAVSDEG